LFFATVGHSEDVDTESALEEVIAQCKRDLNGRQVNAGLLFAGIDSEHQELLNGINAAWPGIELVGCTTAGEFSSRLGLQEDSVCLILFGSDTVEITAGVGHEMSKDIPAACRRAVSEARRKTRQNPALCIALPESMTASGPQVLTALKAELIGNVPVIGATAGDQWQFEGTYQYCGKKVFSDALPILLFSGPLTYSFGVASGWMPIGEPGRVTRSEGAVVFEIDDLPAMAFYRKYLGEAAKPSGECPLAILNDGNEIQYLRAPAGVSIEAAEEITFFGDVPQGERVQITVTDRDAILAGCRYSIQEAKNGYPEDKTLEAAVFFSCGARKLLLGTRTAEEAVIIGEEIGKGVPMCGFYGYGELGPVGSNSRDSMFHNETFISLLMGT